MGHINIKSYLLITACIAASTASAASPQLRLQQRSTFDNTNGTYPVTAPLVALNGTLYGTTSFGGDNNLGVVYRTRPNGHIDVLHSFNGSDGSYPYGTLVAGLHGTMYGTTTTGGAFDQGVVYSIAPNGAFNVVHSFNGSDGSVPSSVLWLPDGYLYGTASGGGDFGEGIVFRMTLSGDLTILHSFTQEEGFSPNGLASDWSGNLWGATQFGGAAQQGTIYRIARDGSNFTLVYTFDGGIQGGDVSQALIAGCDGAMYGTTQYGGTYNAGTLFRVSHSGGVDTLHSFGAGADGAYPGGGSPIALGPTCHFYGLAEFGGTLGGGTLYEADAYGNVRSLYNFDSTVGQASVQIAWPNEIIVTEATAGPLQAGAILRGNLPFGWW